jgi:glycosyltransferase involved in cell wall biosynthesis
VIGVVTTSYPRSPDDSAGVFVRERVRALLADGHKVEILAAKARDGASVDDGCDSGQVTRIEAGHLFYEGGAPEALESPDGMQRLQAFAQGARFSLAMYRQLIERRDRWDVVESHWLVPCGLLAGAALPHLPHRAHVHGGDLDLLARLPWGDSLGRTFCRTKPTLVFASASLRDRFSRLLGAAPEAFGAECTVAPAPFDARVFCHRSDEEKARLRRALGFNAPTVLAAGRLVPIKGFDLLVAAMGRIPAVARPALVIAGEGPEKTRLAGLAREAGVPLGLTGLLGQRALADYMAAADLFIHPCRTLASGRSEGMPLVVREALACGLPVIASASGGLGELLGTQGLTLVDPDDPEALLRAIESALRIGQHQAGCG